MSSCPRVQQRIECEECGYGINECLYLREELPDPGHIDQSETTNDERQTTPRPTSTP